jgi:hypothetical protein
MLLLQSMNTCTLYIPSEQVSKIPASSISMCCSWIYVFPHSLQYELFGIDQSSNFSFPLALDSWKQLLCPENSLKRLPARLRSYLGSEMGSGDIRLMNFCLCRRKEIFGMGYLVKIEWKSITKTLHHWQLITHHLEYLQLYFTSWNSTVGRGMPHRKLSSSVLIQKLALERALGRFVNSAAGFKSKFFISTILSSYR